MTKPLDVTIVHPYYPPAERIGRGIAGLLVLAVRAWAVMLLVAYAFDYAPSFWQTAAAIYAFQVFYGAKDHSFTWARPASKENI